MPAVLTACVLPLPRRALSACPVRTNAVCCASFCCLTTDRLPVVAHAAAPGREGSRGGGRRKRGAGGATQGQGARHPLHGSLCCLVRLACLLASLFLVLASACGLRLRAHVRCSALCGGYCAVQPNAPADPHPEEHKASLASRSCVPSRSVSRGAFLPQRCQLILALLCFALRDVRRVCDAGDALAPLCARVQDHAQAALRECAFAGRRSGARPRPRRAVRPSCAADVMGGVQIVAETDCLHDSRPCHVRLWQPSLATEVAKVLRV